MCTRHRPPAVAASVEAAVAVVVVEEAVRAEWTAKAPAFLFRF